jgi:diguanylate cyclase (GGDEF)-like protein
MRMASYVGASAAIDAVLLLLFALAGSVSYAAPLSYAACAVLTIGMHLWLLQAGRLDALSTRAWTARQLGASLIVELTFLALFPEMAFLFLTVLFVIGAFGSLGLKGRETAMLWIVMAITTTTTLLSVRQQIAMPGGSVFETVLVSACFLAALGRCMFVGLYGSDLRMQLYRRNDELRDSMARVHELASRDDLTGALNRRSLFAVLERSLETARVEGRPFCVALLDLDHFKSVNDRFGHAVGDTVLREFVRCVARTLRVSDNLGRYGGEEFLLVMADVAAPQAAAAVERLRAAGCARGWDDVAPGLRVTASAGLAQHVPGESVSQLIDRADAALYEAKRNGRDRLVIAPVTSAACPAPTDPASPTTPTPPNAPTTSTAR